MKSLELKVPPVAIAFVALALIWLSDRAMPGLTGTSSLALPVATALALAGIACGLAGVLEFRRARTTTDPMNPERASAIVTTGIYSRSRNPMYLGLALIVAGYAAWKGNLAGGLVVPLFVLYMNRFQIVPEERALSVKFGNVFRDYRGKTGRWFQF